MARPGYADLALQGVGGVVLFLVGVGLLADGLKAVAGDRMRAWVGRFTGRRWTAVLTGAAATAVLDSSSAVGIIAVGLVDAGAMTLPQALGVVLGANIGTTVSSQIYALDVVKYGPPLMLPGLVLSMAGRGPTWPHVGRAVLGLGVVFFALTHLERTAEPLADSGPFLRAVRPLENPFAGAAVGAVATAVLQSSSAMMGILIALTGQGAMTLPAAVALMLGAEVGTCVDVLVSTVGRSRAAVRVGVFQLAFNVLTVLLFVGLAGELARLGEWSAPGDVKRQLANAHVAFNVAGVLLAAGFVGWAARAVEWAVPDKGAKTG